MKWFHLISEVDCGVYDASSVGANGVGDVLDADGVEVLVVALGFHKYLLVLRVLVFSLHSNLWFKFMLGCVILISRLPLNIDKLMNLMMHLSWLLRL